MSQINIKMDVEESTRILPTLIEEVISLVKQSSHVENMASYIDFIIRRVNGQVDLLLNGIIDFLDNLIQSELDIFKKSNMLIDRITSISGRHYQLFHAHTFLEIADRMINSIADGEGHIKSIKTLIKRLKSQSYHHADQIRAEYDKIVNESKYDVRLILINLTDAIKILSNMTRYGLDIYREVYVKHQRAILLRRVISTRKIKSSPQ